MNSAGGVRNSVLGICFKMCGQCCLLGRNIRFRDNERLSGSNCGRFPQHAIERQTRFRQSELLDSFYYKTQVNRHSSDARHRTSLPDCSVSYPIFCTPLSGFRFILCSRWDWNSISGWYYTSLKKCK